MYLQIRQEPDISSDLVRRRTKRSKGRQHVCVNFAGVRLRGDGVGILETREFGH